MQYALTIIISTTIIYIKNCREKVAEIFNIHVCQTNHIKKSVSGITWLSTLFSQTPLMAINNLCNILNPLICIYLFVRGLRFIIHRVSYGVPCCSHIVCLYT